MHNLTFGSFKKVVLHYKRYSGWETLPLPGEIPQEHWDRKVPPLWYQEGEPPCTQGLCAAAISILL